jgi:WD40 repeat protein
MMGGAAWAGDKGIAAGGTGSGGSTDGNRIGGDTDVNTRLVAIFSGHTDSVMVLASAAQQQFEDSKSNSRLIFSGSSDKTVKVKSMAGVIPLLQFCCYTPSLTPPLLLHSLANLLRQVWDMDSLSCRRTLKGHVAGVLALAVTPAHLVSGDNNGDILVWSLENFELLRLMHDSSAGENSVQALVVAPMELIAPMVAGAINGMYYS